MKTLFEHIEYVKGQPHHVRKQVAFGAATLGSAFIALVWFAGSYATGAFAIQGSDFAMSTAPDAAIATTNDSGSRPDTNAIAGVAGMLSAAGTSVHIEVVDVAPSAPKKPSEQTILPF